MERALNRRNRQITQVGDKDRVVSVGSQSCERGQSCCESWLGGCAGAGTPTHVEAALLASGGRQKRTQQCFSFFLHCCARAASPFQGHPDLRNTRC